MLAEAKIRFVFYVFVKDGLQLCLLEMEKDEGDGESWRL